MKIGLVRRGFSPTGGAESYLKRLGRALTEAGHEVILYSTPDWPQQEWPYGPLVRSDAASPLRFAKQIEDSRRSDQILFSLDRILKCDCYRAGDGVHKLWLERRIAHEPRWRALFRFANRKHAQLLALERDLLQRGGARHVIANSQMVRREIIHEFAYPEENITVVYNGLPDIRVKRKPLERAEVRRAWDLREHEVAVLFAGSGWNRKGFKYAIRAIARISNPNVRFLVAGTGQKQRQHSDRVRFLGPVSDMQSLYFAADTFVLPTTYDPFSNACLEALSQGLPVITTAANGFAEIIASGVHGEVIERADDIDALQLAIEKWLDPARREPAREHCAEIARGYTIERNVAETLMVLEKLQ
ncbi:MAG: glycosyltransferase family 4 protein [Verrucomicrobia bacterium]|nr:glycosyltransferase family 4 protein [Verrucomicrobiota bacterium]